MSSVGAPNAATIPLSDVLSKLDNDFGEFALAVAEDQYALWLGSGISFDQMPDLNRLIRKMLTHLQGAANLDDNTCPIHNSLKTIIALAELGPEEAARTNLEEAPDTWPDIVTIAKRLASKYSLVLDQAPAGADEDYLLWDAVKVTDEYADPAVAPGAEHYAIAALAIEGAASKMASANWDDLIEKAVRELNGTTAILRVIKRMRSHWRFCCRCCFQR